MNAMGLNCMGLKTMRCATKRKAFNLSPGQDGTQAAHDAKELRFNDAALKPLFSPAPPSKHTRMCVVRMHARAPP